MVVDGFPYSHEYLLLDLRLRMLAPVVDYHIMVEAAFDQLGRKRRLYAGSDAVSAAVLHEFADKMVRVELHEPPREVPFYRRRSTFPVHFAPALCLFARVCCPVPSHSCGMLDSPISASPPASTFVPNQTLPPQLDWSYEFAIRDAIGVEVC
jgi:hypothetical protein